MVLLLPFSELIILSMKGYFLHFRWQGELDLLVKSSFNQIALSPNLLPSLKPYAAQTIIETVGNGAKRMELLNTD